MEEDEVKVQGLLPLVRDPANIREDWNAKTLLHYSCCCGWLDVTKTLVEQYYCNPGCRDWPDGDTPLHVAVRMGHVDIVRYLVGKQRCSTVCNKDGDVPLHVGCRQGNLIMVKALTSGQDCEATYNLQNKDGDTPLHVACCWGHVDIVRYLIVEKRCSTVCQNMRGDVPLRVAFRYGRQAVVEFLTEQNCSLSCESDSLGETLLHYSCRYGWLEVTRRLLGQYCCDSEVRDMLGDTPLHIACHKGHMDIVKYLVSERRCNTACQNDCGNTPLHEACFDGYLDIVEYLVSEQRCNTTCQNNLGNTPLHEACCKGHVDIVRYLVREQGCSTTCENNLGNTPLHLGCLECRLDTVRFLIGECGCSTACGNKDGDTPLHLACRASHVAIAGYLVSEQRCSTTCQNKKGDTPLHEACRKGDLAVVEALMGGPNCKAACTYMNKDGDAPLHVACRKGHEHIVRYLVSDQGCDAACQNKAGDTALHCACRCDRSRIVQFLLSTGRVDPWCKNNSGETPLQVSPTQDSSMLSVFADLPKGNLQMATKVFVFGSRAAGKSTLVKIIENRVTSQFGALAGRFRNVSGVELNTAGINTVTIQNSRLGTVTIYDLAGQFEYYSSHDALVENLVSSSAALFIAVVKLNESEAEVIRTLQYWISFIENCCSRVDATAHLMIVGSWADKVKAAGEDVKQKWSNIEEACISSSSPLIFVGFRALDCRKLASGGLGKILDMMQSSCTALREADIAAHQKVIYPNLLHAFIDTKLGTEMACSVGKLCTHIRAEGGALLPTEPNLLSPLLNSLSDGGHLLYIPNKEDILAGWVVIDKQAVLSEFNGTVFAPEKFIQHHDIATNTGVVPTSKIADLFGEKYNVGEILSVLTIFEFSQEIKDSFALSLITSSNPSTDSSAAIMTTDVFESCYFFPALVRVECPTDVWQSSGPGQYQCGWCLQCSKEGQYLTPRFLHVVLLRLAFSFALAPDSSQQDEASPVLRRKCSIWKSGIQWRNQNGVETIVEVSEQNKLVSLLMSCPEGEEMVCVELRSSLVSKLLKTKEELCPGISTTELLIDPSNLSSYPLPSSNELTLYRMADQIFNAVEDCELCAVDTHGRKGIQLVRALHFEPYLGMHTRVVDRFFGQDLANQVTDDNLLHELAATIHLNLIQQVPLQMALRIFNIPNDQLFYNNCDDFPDERDSPIVRCFCLLLTWKNCDTGGGTYQSLRNTLDKYSIFCGRNPVSYISWNELFGATI